MSLSKEAKAFQARLRAQGIPQKRWALERGYDPTYVSRILNGSIKASYGKAHQIAVEMGLKPAAENHHGQQ